MRHFMRDLEAELQVPGKRNTLYIDQEFIDSFSLLGRRFAPCGPEPCLQSHIIVASAG